MPRTRRESTDDLLVPADVLGAFGVTPAEIGHEPADGATLETALADALSTGVDRTTVLRRTIARSDRGLACPARYSAGDLERELTAVFEAIGWSLAVTHTRNGLELAATDPRGRRRDTSVSYPETPLGSDNLPAVLWTVNDAVLAGTDARFVLLSSGVDRWRAALIEAGELERLRDRYGPRIEAVDRPLLPERGLEAYVPAATDDSPKAPGSGRGPGADDPWPPWARRRDGRRSVDSPASVDALIDEAEPAARSDRETPSEGASSEIDGFELRGTAGVSRRDEGEARSETRERTATGFDDAAATDDWETADDSGRFGRTASGDDGQASGDDESTDDGGFGTLSGTCETARIDNDAFGTDDDHQSEDDRYRALGAALDAGGNVSVRGLLEDDDFLPELPAVESVETRIEFADGCGPVDIPTPAAAVERSGFEWVDTGSLETTRVSDG